MPQDNMNTGSPSLLLYALLPSLIQRRMPKLRSLRRTLSSYDPKCHTRAYSEPTVVGNITPPPSYQSESEDEDEEYEMPPPTPRRRNQTTPRPLSSGSTTPYNTPEDSQTGINWRFADPGFSLLSLAAHEAGTLNPSTTFIRRQYIDGAACILRGLPSDLTEEEATSLREALPSSPTQHEQALILTGFNNNPHPNAQQRSTLHHLTALLTLYLLLAFATLLPYLRRLYAYDREHRISDRVLAKSVEVADVMGKKTLDFAQNFCEGRVGDVVKETGVYFVRGVSGGVYEGLGEALRVRGMGLER